MLEGNHIYSLISLFVGALMLFLAGYIFSRKHNDKVSNAFIITMCLGSFAAVLDFLLLNAESKDAALILGRMAIFFSVCMLGGFFYTAISLAFGEGRSKIIESEVVYALIVGLSGLLPAVSIAQVESNSFGYGVTPDLGYWIWIFIGILYMVAAVFILTEACLRSKSRSVRRQCIFISVAIAIPLVYNISLEIVDEALNLDSPPLISVGFLFTALILTYVVFKDKMFIIEPVKEDLKPRANFPGRETPKGSCRLIESKRSDAAYTKFINEVAAGNGGMLISRVHPDHIKERYGLVKTPIIWLTGQPGQMRIDPSSLSILQHTIIEFMQKSPNTVVLLDGLEYLISNNSLEKVIRIIYVLRDAAVISGSKIIIPLDPDVLTDRELALIERELEVEKVTDEGNFERSSNIETYQKEGAGSEI